MRQDWVDVRDGEQHHFIVVGGHDTKVRKIPMGTVV